MSLVMPSFRRNSRDLALTIEDEFKKIFTSVSFTLFKGKVSGYDSSRPEAAFLSPDQDAVNTFFLRTGGLLRPEVRNALETFFNRTVKACELYRALLKSIQEARQSQSSINQALQIVHKLQQEGNTPSQSLHNSVLIELKTFANSKNPFTQETLDQFRLVQECSEQLERELREMKHALGLKLRKERALSKVLPYLILAAGSPILLCLAVPAALAGLIVSNVTVDAMSTLKNWWFAVRERFSNSDLEAQCSQLDAADKGNYIIIQDLMTSKRLVTRLRNDVDSTKRRISFFEEAMQDYGSMCVIVHQLRINATNSEQQMKEFSEQVVFCCRTIEKARKLVFEKITGQPWDGPLQFFSGNASSSDDV